MGKVKIGDYVIATKYRDGDPKDQWAVGIVQSITNDTGIRYHIGDGDSVLFRGNGFRRAKKIAPETGERILQLREHIDLGARSVWYILRKIEKGEL